MTTQGMVGVPAPLRSGDTVVVIGPGSPCTEEHLSAGLELLRSWGLRPEVLGRPSESAPEPLLHLAGDDADRARQLVDGLSRPGVAAVFCTRGGTGCGRTLDAISDSDWEVIRLAQPRWLVGASDVTALHQALSARVGWASVFGPMVATDVVVGSEPNLDSVAALRDVLMNPTTVRPIQGRTAVSGAPVTASVVGGTITVIESLLSTPDSFSSAGRIALLEDINEPPRRLDRSLTHLRRSGWFDGAVGVAVGSLHECGQRALDVVLERVGDLGVPVLVDLPIGHGPRQESVVLGTPMVLDPVAAQLRFGSQ